MKTSAIWLFCFLVSCQPVLAAGPSHWWENDPVFLGKDEVAAKLVVQAPPAPHSDVDDADHLELLRVQEVRTPVECERARTEVHISLESLFGPHYGPLKEAEVKKWSGFFEEVATDTDYFVRVVKKEWKRPRPYVAFSDVHPCASLEKSMSYPSGHAAISRAFADLLSVIYPGRKQKFMARARQIAGDRVLSGIHHPSDIEAGKRLGDAVSAALLKNARFEQELKRLESE